MEFLFRSITWNEKLMIAWFLPRVTPNLPLAPGALQLKWKLAFSAAALQWMPETGFSSATLQKRPE
jgi:hypothetical protein